MSKIVWNSTKIIEIIMKFVQILAKIVQIIEKLLELLKKFILKHFKIASHLLKVGKKWLKYRRIDFLHVSVWIFELNHQNFITIVRKRTKIIKIDTKTVQIFIKISQKQWKSVEIAWIHVRSICSKLVEILKNSTDF